MQTSLKNKHKNKKDAFIPKDEDSDGEVEGKIVGTGDPQGSGDEESEEGGGEPGEETEKPLKPPCVDCF